VVAIIGPTLSQQAFAADPMAERAGVPVLAPSNTAKGIPQLGQFISRISAPSSVLAPNSLNKVLQETPTIRRVAVFYAQNDAFSKSETEVFQQAVRERGLTLTTVQKVQTTDTDFQTQVTAALNTKPDLVIISALAVDGGNLVRQLRQLGYRGPIIAGNGMNTRNIFPVCQKDCEGLTIAQAYSPALDTPINRQFREGYRRLNPGQEPPQFSAQAFAAFQVLTEALRAVNARTPLKTLTLAELRRNLNQQLLAGRYDTPLGEIRFTPEGEVFQQNFYVARVKMNPDGQSGRFTLVP
jgi:branched-chain amino acid transport system substrate-binding protein